MIRNDAKVRQICTLFIAFLPLLKIVGAPAAFSVMCGEKLLLAAAVLLILDFSFIFLYMFYARRFEGVAFFDMLSDGYGKAFARAVFFVYGIFYKLVKRNVFRKSNQCRSAMSFGRKSNIKRAFVGFFRLNTVFGTIGKILVNSTLKIGFQLIDTFAFIGNKTFYADNFSE